MVRMSRENRERRRREINVLGHAHELTFSCYRRFTFLRAERTCRWLADALQAARDRHEFDLWAYVFMPDHVHLIVYPRKADHSMRSILAGIKLPVARRAIHFLEATQSPWLERLTRQRGLRTERLFWQSGGGYDRNIISAKTLLQMLDYLHLNPVRRGLVQQAREWLWSSASYFEGGSSPIPLDPIPAQWLVG
jgi:putative transposase